MNKSAMGIKFLLAAPIPSTGYHTFDTIYEQDEPVKETRSGPPIQITDIRQIGPSSLLLKWLTGIDQLDGYEVYVDGKLKSRIFNRSRTGTVVDYIRENSNAKVEIYAVKNQTRCHPPASTFFKLGKHVVF